MAAVRIWRLAAKQWGVVTRAQIERCGLNAAGITRWISQGRLHRLHPGVYALGHAVLTIEGKLAAALLHAGPGALLSHLTAAEWWGLLRAEPRPIEVSAPGRARSTPAVRVHHPSDLPGMLHRGLPVTTVPRTLLDIAGLIPFRLLRRAVAEAEYRQLLNIDAAAAALGRGRRGSAALRTALAHHRPQLARTRSVLEERFLALCEDHGLPLPEVNAEIAGLMVDALWREQRMIVELDGHAAHGTRAAIERDRGRELTLRANGYRVLRYTWQQVTGEPERVVHDLRRELAII